jgi:hypothetical protein
MLYEIKHVQEDRAGRRRMRHVHRAATVRARERPSHVDGIAREVVEREDAALRLHLAHDRLGNLAVIKRVGPALGDRRERAREVRAPDRVALLQDGAARREDVRPVWVARHDRAEIRVLKPGRGVRDGTTGR